MNCGKDILSYPVDNAKTFEAKNVMERQLRKVCKHKTYKKKESKKNLIVLSLYKRTRHGV